MYKKLGAAFIAVWLLTAAGCETTGPKYKNVGEYREGLAAVQISNGKWGYINDSQQFVIRPQFDDAKNFSDGKAAVKRNGKWGFINRAGKWL